MPYSKYEARICSTLWPPNHVRHLDNLIWLLLGALKLRELLVSNQTLNKFTQQSSENFIKIVESELRCDKVYVRKGALHSHIKNKHKGEQRQPDQEDQGQLFLNIGIPEDLEDFPGPSDETMREASEAAEQAEAEAADPELQQTLNQPCDNCATAQA